MHKTTKRFWMNYSKLPVEIQQLADQKFELLKSDIRHPSLHFKNIGLYCSVRIGLEYRALAVENENVYTWVWIGNHEEYERLITK
ncbi:MAG: hypothetical protein HQK91_15085 [Nitrospirae bacterium]|nr:hypothetical protein [Nitrospirota bacterium]